MNIICIREEGIRAYVLLGNIAHTDRTGQEKGET